jgi:hypothetical protein
MFFMHGDGMLKRLKMLQSKKVDTQNYNNC